MNGARRDVRMDGEPVKRRQKAPSEPAPRYGVVSGADAAGRVWHYPVAWEEPYSPVFFMRPASARPGAARIAVRFRSRLRAVRFTQEDAALERETMRELKRLLTARSMAAGPEREGT